MLKKNLLFIFAIFLIVNISFLSATFDKSNIDTWSENPDSIKQFEKLSDSDKDKAWASATKEQKEKFIVAYSKSKGREIKFSGFSSKDLTWEGSKLKSKNVNKIVSFDFDSARDSLKKVSYDEKTKTMTYEFERGEIKNQIKIDDGFIDKEGYHYRNVLVKGMISSSLASTKSAQVTYGNGLVEYKDGQYIISKNSDSDRGILIGNSLYTSAEKNQDTIVKPVSLDLEKGILTTTKTSAVYTNNAKILIQENADSEKYSAVLTTGFGLNEDGSPRLIAFFDGNSVPKEFNDPYAYIDFSSKSVVLNDNKAITRTDSYMQLEIFTNFKDIKGSGSQTWIKNGEALFDFHEGQILFYEGVKNGHYEINSISDLNNPDPNKNVFTFKKFRDNPYADFFDKEATVVNSGALVSDTSGMYVHGPRGRILGGSSETGSSNLIYDQEYSEGYYKGTEEEKIAAIARDPNTVVEVHGTPSVNIPGQYFASEILSNLDYQMAVAGLEASDRGENLNARIALMDAFIGNRNLNNPPVREDLVSTIINGRDIPIIGKIQGLGDILREENPGISDFQVRQRAEQLVDAYTIKKNYQQDFDYSKVTQENINQMPSINRLLYEASTAYAGSVHIPYTTKEARKSGGPSSSGGFSGLQIRSDGFYLDGQLIPGVKPEVASAFRTTMANQLLNFEQGVATRQSQIARYGTRINDAGYAFDINDYRTERHFNNVFSSRIVGARAVGQSALNLGHAQLGEKESRYQYYRDRGRLP